MIAGILAGATIAARAQAPQGPAPPVSVDGLAAVAAIEQALVAAIDKAERSVVAIRPVPTSRASARDAFRGGFPGVFPLEGDDLAADQEVPTHYGSGVVVGEQGLVLTNYHVLDGRTKHEVVTINRKTFRTEVLAADPRSDLAVLKVTEPVPATGEFEPITFGQASKLRKGQIVIALGNPYAIASDGQASASWGIVANLARKAPPKPEVRQFADPPERAAERRPTLHHFGTLIQTDAKLNLGTSGGALVNLQGEMIGLTTSLAAIAGYEQSAGYAIPVDDTFRRIVETLSEGKEVEYGFLGVSLPAEDENWPASARGGQVKEVIGGTPAAQAGLLQGDLITEIGGQPIFDADELMLNIGRRPPASRVTLIFHRGAGVRQTEVVLAKSRIVGEKVFVDPGPQWRGMRLDYWTATPLLEEFQSVNPARFAGGVAVVEVSQDGLAARAGVAPLMLITHVDGVRVASPAEFFEHVAGARGPVKLRIWGGDTLVVPTS